MYKLLNMSRMLIDFINSLNADKELSEALTMGYKTIFEAEMSSTGAGMYSQGIGDGTATQDSAEQPIDPNESKINAIKAHRHNQKVMKRSSEHTPDGIKNLQTSNIDDGTYDYIGSDGTETDVVNDLAIFDITKATIHDAGSELADKFHNTETYKSIIPEMKAHADSMKLMKSHMNTTSNMSIKILKA